MKIIAKESAIHARKPEGLEVWYYLFGEYEVHYDEQQPHTKQIWHLHKDIHETLYLIEGALVVLWKENGRIEEKQLHEGDLVETEHTDHCFENRSDHNAKFIILKQILQGNDKSAVIQNDKIVTDKNSN